MGIGVLTCSLDLFMVLVPRNKYRITLWSRWRRSSPPSPRRSCLVGTALYRIVRHCLRGCRRPDDAWWIDATYFFVSSPGRRLA